ncbi:clpC [Symbiodinium pilosum]|uniref:ClpC protein n=1 Tax=Symbiodinium pilosum TaxID=2952 RepID=A0A812S2F5_SYMPI|nr:clpC [Symbiodinium pilosum]
MMQASAPSAAATSAVKVISKTWARDSHDLFDFEAHQLHTQTFSVPKSTVCMRNGTEVQMVGERDVPPAGGDPLLRLVQRDGTFWVDKAQPSSNSKKLWLVVRDLVSSSHRLQEGDVIKLGRFKFRVRQLVASSYGGMQPELRLDDSGVICCAVEPTGNSEGPQVNKLLCRICLLEGPGEDQDDPLIAPCQCKGSIEYVHLGCLRHWIRGRLNLSDRPLGSYFYRPLTCELCKSVYPTYIHTNSGQERQPLVEVPFTQPPFIVLENMVRDSQQHTSRGLHVISLAEKELKLGRGHESDVRIADVSISRTHATIRFSKGQFLLQDSSSKFGTLVAMKKPRVLEPGVNISIQMGRTVLTLCAQHDPNHSNSASSLNQLPVGGSAQDERALRLSLLTRGQSEGGQSGGQTAQSEELCEEWLICDSLSSTVKANLPKTECHNAGQLDAPAFLLQSLNICLRKDMHTDVPAANARGMSGKLSAESRIQRATVEMVETVEVLLAAACLVLLCTAWSCVPQVAAVIVAAGWLRLLASIDGLQADLDISLGYADRQKNSVPGEEEVVFGQDVVCQEQVFDRFRQDAITAIYSQDVVSTELIILGIISEQKGANLIAKTALAQRSAVKRFIVNNPRPFADTSAGSGSLPFSENARLLFDTANADSVGNAEIGCEQLLLALSQPDLAECGGAKMLAGLGVSGDVLRIAVSEAMSAPGPPERQLAAVGADESSESDMTLDEVATDLTQMALDGLLDPVMGRQEEMDRIIQILLRKRKNNACLVGPPGVGKTAVVEGLAIRIAEGKVPGRLKGKQVYSLDLGQLVAGTKYRGEFEDRLKKVLNEVTSDERDVCLFIDEIHQIVGAGAAGADSSMDAANLLKPSLARGELQVIGATTVDEYTKHIEKDAALERRFQRVSCEEPSVAETVEVLEGLRPSYEAHHGVLLTPDALQAAARLSDRYVNDRFLPDKAVDLIDEASSLAQWRAEMELEEANQQAEPDELSKPLVTAQDVANILAKWSGIPVERLSEGESDRLMRLEECSPMRSPGQAAAVSALSRAVRRARSGLAGSSRPTASFFFAGPTGVGKTELCRVLAEEYYADLKAMVRLDMSEFSEPHSVSRLIGAPPGYVGYDDPRSGQLTEAVRRRPYSVVVLDEIEKAHSEVLNLLLQVLEDGRLTDGKGRTVNFSNCIIVMTSNVGSQEILQQASGVGTYDQLRAAVQRQLQQKFRPEFLNRIDELLIFQALTEQEFKEIVRLVLGNAKARALAAFEETALQNGRPTQPLDLSWTADVEELVLASGSNAIYGARPLRRAVQRIFEDPLAEFLVCGAFNQGGAATVAVENGDVVIRYNGSTLRPTCAAAITTEALVVPRSQEIKKNNQVPSAVAVS